MGYFEIQRTLFAFLAFVLLLSPGGCSWNATPPAIIIGHVSDKARADKAGEYAELGIRLAMAELNKDNALAETFQGRAVQVRHTDTRGNLDAFTSQAVRLDSINRAVVLLGGTSAREVSAIANVKTPIVAFHGAGAPSAAGQVLHLGIAPKAQGEILAIACQQPTLPAKVFLIQDERLADAGSICDAFTLRLQSSAKEKKSPVDLLATRFGEKAEWSKINQRLREHSPDLVLFAGETSDFNIWHADLRKKKTNLATIVFAGSDGDQMRFDLGEMKTPRLIFATAYHSGADNEKNRAFVKAYSAAYAETPSVHAALAYDGLRLTIEAMKRTTPLTTPERVREELLKPAEIESVTGPCFLGKSGPVSRTVYVVGWQNNQLSVLHTESAKKEE